LRVDLYPELIEILSGTAQLIKSRNFFLWRREGEANPAEIPLAFKPVIAEKVIERTLDKNACVLCTRRISYKKDQFVPKKIRQPYLFLVHNDFLGPRAGFYNEAAENSLFEKMIEGVLGFHPRDVLVREILRCHFSTEETGEEAQLQNCELHIRHDIENHSLKGIILFGKAATLLFRDKTVLSAKQNQVFDWQGLPAIVCSGPNRLQYMREKNFAKDQIDAERQKIFETLRIFKDKIIGVTSA
jgi:hypothetical protein